MFCQNYGSRIDRFYCNNRYNIVKSKVIHCSFSDHSAISITININQNICIGKSYWKLNTSLLDDAEVKENFNTLWHFMKTKQYDYDNITAWWENCAKPYIKKFFIREGKRKSKEKYGLIDYLENVLKKLYTDVATSNTLNYQRVKHIKARIDKLKTEILEGIQIRTKAQEIKYGEIPSSFLVGKQSSEGKRKTIYRLTAEESNGNIIEGELLNTTDNINKYAYSFYRNLYAQQTNEITEQTDFLNALEPKIGELENEMLIKRLDREDIFQALNSTENNKSPGLDGLPYEFYKTYWELIKDDLLQILNNVLTTLSLTESQSLAVIILHPKSGDTKLLSNWRPISLMNCDYKIMAKVFANRLKLVVPEIISKEQFCCP